LLPSLFIVPFSVCRCLLRGCTCLYLTHLLLPSLPREVLHLGVLQINQRHKTYTQCSTSSLCSSAARPIDSSSTIAITSRLHASASITPYEVQSRTRTPAVTGEASRLTLTGPILTLFRPPAHPALLPLHHAATQSRPQESIVHFPKRKRDSAGGKPQATTCRTSTSLTVTLENLGCEIL
jgi:hypothetical protein